MLEGASPSLSRRWTWHPQSVNTSFGIGIDIVAPMLRLSFTPLLMLVLLEGYVVGCADHACSESWISFKFQWFSYDFPYVLGSGSQQRTLFENCEIILVFKGGDPFPGTMFQN